MEWERGEFEISTTFGATTVEGMVSRPFGIHYLSGYWWVTHLPSGIKFPFGFETITDAETVTAAIRSVWNAAEDPYPHADLDAWKPVARRIKVAIDSTGIPFIRAEGNLAGSDYEPRNGYGELA